MVVLYFEKIKKIHFLEIEMLALIVRDAVFGVSRGPPGRERISCPRTGRGSGFIGKGNQEIPERFVWNWRYQRSELNEKGVSNQLWQCISRK